MKNLVFLFGFLLFISCGNRKKDNELSYNKENSTSVSTDTANVKNPEEAYTLNGNYKVLQVKDEEVAKDSIIMNFDYDGGLVTVKTICYNIRSNFEQNDNNIQFQEPIRTPKDCKGDIEYEDFDKILPNITHLTKKDSTFNLLDSNENLILKIRKK